MKLNKSKLAIGLIAASAASVSFMSHAESVSLPSTVVVPLAIVAATGSSVLDLNPVASLPEAGVSTPDGVTVAKAVNNVIGTATQSGIRFTPGKSTQDIDQSDNAKVTLHGITPGNDLYLRIKDLGDATWKTYLTDTYLVTNSAVQSQSLDIAVSGGQAIAADTYNLSMDGAVYNP